LAGFLMTDLFATKAFKVVNSLRAATMTAFISAMLREEFGSAAGRHAASARNMFFALP
jgi:hypothetical protein